MGQILKLTPVNVKKDLPVIYPPNLGHQELLRAEVDDWSRTTGERMMVKSNCCPRKLPPPSEDVVENDPSRAMRMLYLDAAEEIGSSAMTASWSTRQCSSKRSSSIQDPSRWKKLANAKFKKPDRTNLL